MEVAKADIIKLEKAASEINLFLNHDKSEIISIDEPSKASILSLSPNFTVVDPAKVTLLGSPIGGEESLHVIWESKVEQLETLGSRLKLLQAYDALCLLQNALAIPKVMHILRTAPIVSGHQLILDSFDCVLRSLLESICNIHLFEQNWIQASLPINLGGLGIRSVTMLAPSAFLASAAGTSSITLALIPPTCSPEPCPLKAEAVRLWKASSGS